MNPPKLLEDLDPGPEHQVVSICENDLRSETLERIKGLRAHRGLRAHGHEYRSQHLGVKGAKPPGTGIGAVCGGFEFETESRHDGGRYPTRTLEALLLAGNVR